MSKEMNLDMPQASGDAPEEDAKAPTSTPTLPKRKEQQDHGEEESASNVLRRLSSPIFGTAGFASDGNDDNGRGNQHYDSDRSQEGDEEEEEDEVKEGAAELIQRWWRECRRASKRVRAVVAAKPAFVRVQQLFDKLDAGQMSFERTGLALQNPDIQRAVTKALSVVPRDEGLIAMPRASRSTRAVLSSLMIVYHPSEVLVTEDGVAGAAAEAASAAAATASASSTTPPSPTRMGVGAGAASGGAAAVDAHDGGGGDQKKMDPVAAALRNASGLLLASIKAVTSSLGPVITGETGARKTLEVRLNVLRLCRRYFAVSLVAWKDKDANRVAAQVVQPYARAYAMRLTAVAQGDERVADMVQGQLDQYRRALEQLIGQQRASNSLQEVELAVKADISLSLDANKQEEAPAAAAAASTAPANLPSSSSSCSSSSAAVTGDAVAAAGTAGPFPKNGTSNSSGGRNDSSSAPHDGNPAPRAANASAGGHAGSGSGGGNGGDGDYRLPDGRLGRLLGNERLAHEILVNPDFQIPGNEGDDGASPASSPEEELARRFKDVMRRIFWDRFTQSLLPPPDTEIASKMATNNGVQVEDVSDVAAGAEVGVPGLPRLRVGSKVHARYGSERGSYYVATVLAVVAKDNEGIGNCNEQDSQSPAREAGSAVPNGATRTAGHGGGGGAGGGSSGVFVDIRYDEDGTVERGVPVSRLKKRDDPPDFGPLLSLLGEVREELVSLTPNNAILVGEVRAVLSKERLAELLQDKKLDARQVQRLVGFIASRIHALQAPVREAGARNWLKGFDSQMEAAAASGDASSVIHLLPRVFEFVFAQMEEIKRDSANAHIRLIAPYLARHGAAYERAKFQARLSDGTVTLDLTRAWLSSAVKGFLSADAGEGGTGDDGERTRRAKGLRDGREELHKSVLQQAFVGLLRSSVRLDRPEAAATILPETLRGDGGRLADARDDVDRVTLVATLCVLVRQVLARLRIACPVPAMAALQARTCSLLKQEGVHLPQIVEECVATAGRLAVASASAPASTSTSTPSSSSSKDETTNSALPSADKDSLRSLLMSSADPNNEVFRVFFKRVLLALKGMVAGGDAADVCERNGMQSFVDELRPAGARLHRLFAHNIKVHAGLYGPIVTEAARATT
eukprot:g10740.t1